MKKLFKFINAIKENKLLNIIRIIIKTILYILLIGLVIVIIVQKVTNNNLAIGGVRAYTVATGSMEPVYHVGDFIISKHVDANKLKVGDDVTYLGKEGTFDGLLITHRIIDLKQENGKYIFQTKGTANEIADAPIDESQIYGKVVYKVKTLSFISRLISNIYWYYAICTIVGITFSFQVVSIIYNNKDEDEDDDDEDDDDEEDEEE